MRRVIIAGLIGWSATVALAWWLADRRLDRCYSQFECSRHAMAVRDNVLIWGPGIAVAYLVAAGLAGLLGNDRLDPRRPGQVHREAKRAEPTRLP